MIKRKLGLLIIIIGTLIVDACSNKEEDNKIITVAKDFSELKISDISSDIKEIPLEFSEETMIGIIGRVAFTKDYLFVHDASNSRILQFDYNGKFIKQIGVKGEGPGEYKYLSSFTVDEATETIYLSASAKLLKYNFNGEFLKEIRGLNFVNSIQFLEKELKVFQSKFGYKSNEESNLYNLEILSTYSGNLERRDSLIVKKILVSNQVGTTFPQAKFFSGSENNYYFYIPVLIPENQVRDTLYSFENNKIAFHKKIDFSIFKSPNSKKKPINIKSMIKVGRYYIVEYVNKGMFTYFYNTDTNQGYLLKDGIQAKDFVMEEHINLFPVLNYPDRAYFTGKPTKLPADGFEPNSSVFLVTLN